MPQKKALLSPLCCFFFQFTFSLLLGIEENTGILMPSEVSKAILSPHHTYTLCVYRVYPEKCERLLPWLQSKSPTHQLKRTDTTNTVRHLAFSYDLTLMELEKFFNEIVDVKLTESRKWFSYTFRGIFVWHINVLNGGVFNTHTHICYVCDNNITTTAINDGNAKIGYYSCLHLAQQAHKQWEKSGKSETYECVYGTALSFAMGMCRTHQNKSPHIWNVLFCIRFFQRDFLPLLLLFFSLYFAWPLLKCHYKSNIKWLRFRWWFQVNFYPKC